MCSPRRDAIHNEFKKKHGGLFHFMKVWTSEEMLSFITNIDAFKMKKNSFIERYEALGGFPRRVFFPNAQISLDEEIQNIVEKCGDIDTLSNFTQLQSKDCPSECHALLKMVCKDEIRPYYAGGFEFATKRLAFELVNRIMKTSPQSLITAFQVFSSKGLGLLAGGIFEPLVILSIKDGHTFLTRQTDNTASKRRKLIELKLGPSEKGYQ